MLSATHSARDGLVLVAGNAMSAILQPVARTSKVVVVGLGNIGSNTVQLLAGIDGVDGVTLIDHDHYDTSNLYKQRIGPKDVGKQKVDVQARALRKLAPDLTVAAWACPFAAVPLGRLRDSVILACVDSRIARQSINQAAFWLGIPWIDAGLDRAGSVRTRIYIPGAGNDCMECAYSASDYALLEQRVPCDAASFLVPATAAPAELGAIAAGLQVSQLRRLLSANTAEQRAELARQQYFYDAASGRGWVGRYSANPDCRFDHMRLPVQRLARSAQEITLREISMLAGAAGGAAVLSVAGHTFVRRVHCTGCGQARKVRTQLLARLRRTPCGRCGGAMLPAAPDVFETLSLTAPDAPRLARRLSEFGLVDGDVISLHAGDKTAHYELAGINEEKS